MLEVLLTACLLICVIIKCWRARLAESRAHPLPPVFPGVLPIIGHIHMLATDKKKIWLLLKKITEYSIQQGGVIYGLFGSQIYYAITDPEDALLVANTCMEKHFLYSFAKYWLGEGLFTASGGHWHHHRQMLKSSFSLPIINGYVEVFNSQSRVLVSDMGQNVGQGKFYPSPYLKLHALRTSYLTTFGKVADDNFCLVYMKTIEAMFCRIVQRFHTFWLHNDFIYTLLGQKKKDLQLATTVNGISDEVLLVTDLEATVVYEALKSLIMRHTKKSLLIEANNSSVSSYVSHKPLIDRLLEQRTRNNFTDQEITDEVHTAIAAAFETTSNSLDTILVMIGSFPKVQERMFEEIIQTMGTDRDVTKEDLRKLVYTEAVIKETLRVIPTVPDILRSIDRDVKLKNYTLRAGSECILLLLGLNRHPSWGPDADQFRPERWLDTATLPNNTITDAVFSFGKRSCIGKTYAMTSIKITIAHMVRNYIITADHTKLQHKMDMTLSAVSGHEITLERRS